MKTLRMLAAGFLSIGVLSLMTPSMAQAETRIGFVDLQKAIEMTTAGKKAKSELEKEFESKKKDLQKRESDLKKMQEDLEKKKSVLSEEVRNRRQAEFQQEFTKFQQTVNESEQSIRVREQQLTQPILDKLQKAIAEHGKEEGYSVILHQSERMQLVLWSVKEVDLTEAVVKRFETTGDSSPPKKK